MPGSRLSHLERRLATFWDSPPAQFDKPLLRQLRIDGGPGLRGIRSLVVPFGFPLTMICGRNGVGKSTVLGLAAHSARPPAGWRVHWGNTRPRTRPGARAQYSFGDFFHRQRGVPPPNGLRLTWVFFADGSEFEVVEEMNRGRWISLGDTGRHRQYGGRPRREVDYVPIARALPAIEQGAVRAAFSGSTEVAFRELLSESAVQKLAYILGRSYGRASTGFIRGLGLAECSSEADYSGFDMGTGEASVIALLSRLEALPRGGLLVVEEVELGLHAEAQSRLVEILVGYCVEKQVQIIGTTHSPAVLDAVPRRARVLLRREGHEHTALPNVSTRFSVHEMLGQPQPELLIYAEDTFARYLVEEALPEEMRRRIRVREVGSSATLARQLVAHLRVGQDLKALSVFDGDCTREQIEGWIRSESAGQDFRPDWLVLPADGLTPERWVLRELRVTSYCLALSQDLHCSLGAAEAHVEAMSVQLDHHDCGRALSMRTGLPDDLARRMVARAVARNHPGLDPLKRMVTDRLDPPGQ